MKFNEICLQKDWTTLLFMKNDNKESLLYEEMFEKYTVKIYKENVTEIGYASR